MSFPFNQRVVRETSARAVEAQNLLTAALAVIVSEVVRGVSPPSKLVKASAEWREATGGSAARDMPMLPKPRVQGRPEVCMADGGLGDVVVAPRCDWCRSDPSFAANHATDCVRCAAWRELAAMKPPAYVLDTDADDARVAEIEGTPWGEVPGAVVDIIDESGLASGEWTLLGNEEPTAAQVAEYVEAVVAGHFDAAPAAARDWEW